MVAVTFYGSSHFNLHQQLAVLAPMAVIGYIAFYRVNKNVVQTIAKKELQLRVDYILESVNTTNSLS